MAKFFISLGYAQAGVSAFCDDAEQWGAEQAAFLHLKNLSAVWHRVSHLALNAVVTLNADIDFFSPATARTPQFSSSCVSTSLPVGGPCLDVNGQPYVPELPQRRPAPRRVIDKPCIVEHTARRCAQSSMTFPQAALTWSGPPRWRQKRWP